MTSRSSVVRHLSAVCAAAALAMAGLVAAPAVFAAGHSTSFAYPNGGASSPTTCPLTSVVAKECTLSQALGLVRAGGTVALAVSGDATDPSTFYSGGFSVSTPDTSAGAPVTIAPASGVSRPILDGGSVQRVLHIDARVYAVVDGVTIQHGTAEYGGGIMLASHANLTVTSSMLVHNRAIFGGGAIISGYRGTGTLAVSGSTFTDNLGTYNGGAIMSGYKGGTGTLTVTGSTFTGNRVTKHGPQGGGGAIISGYLGNGTATVTGSTFTGNSAVLGGGAIDSCDVGTGTLTVTRSTFTANHATEGGAIDSCEHGTGTLVVTGSTFNANTAKADGGAVDNGEFSGGHGTFTVKRSTFSNNTAGENGGVVDNGDGGGNGRLTVTRSTFSGNAAGVNGGAIDSGDYTGIGRLTVTGSTFAGNTASDGNGDTIDNGDDRGTGTVRVGANEFDGSCDQGSGTWTDLGYNTTSDASCFSSPPATGDDDSAGSALSALLGPLADNGGPTRTIALLVGNPGILAIPNGSAGGFCPVLADQRGVASPAGQACDTGAVQLAGQTVTFTSRPPAHAHVGDRYHVAATATSGLPVSFSIDSTTPPGVCTVSGSTVTFTGVGTCVIDADQNGDNGQGAGNWMAGETASQSVMVTAP